MTRLLAACLLAPTLALADGGVTVRLPDISSVPAEELPDMLAGLVTAIVVGQNCNGFHLTDGEWALLTGTADMVAARMGLSTKDYDARYWEPAFVLVDSDFGCAVEGDSIRPLIDALVSVGGTTVPVN